MAEAVVVYGAIVLYVWWLRFVVRASWLGILFFIILSHVRRRETPADLGFRRANFGRSLRQYGAVLLSIAVLLLAFGGLFRTLRNVEAASAVASFALYCCWGLFQQYLLNGYFVNRFREAFPQGGHRSIALMVSLLFAGVHTPNWFLMIITLAGGYLCARAYLQYRNLFFLGIAHGLVGFLIYLTVPDSISHHLYVGPKWFTHPASATFRADETRRSVFYGTSTGMTPFEPSGNFTSFMTFALGGCGGPEATGTRSPWMFKK